MAKLTRFRAVLLIALLTALAATALSPAAVAAGTGITVSGALLVAEVTPGEILTHIITVTTGTDELPTDAIIKTGDIGQAADGSYVMLDNTADNNSFSACAYISLDKDSVHLIPGVPQEITATVRVPDNIGEGGRYAVINIQTQPAGSGNIGVVSAINIPVYLTIKQTDLIHQGKITSISTGEIISGEPIVIVTAFQNTGNHHFKYSGEVTVSNANGEILDTIFITLTATSLMPDMARESRATFIPAEELQPGVYSIHSRIIAEDGTMLDEANASFELKTPLIPPPAPAKQTVIPTDMALLHTTNSSVSIEFPKGAVTEAVEVTLRDYPLLQLPPLPPEYQATAICFRIDGISGLLVEDATITVKFTGAELDNAGGDTNRLKLAYWDETTGKWTVLKTKADKTAMSLTATTNHFSIWTVIVSPAKSNNITAIAGAIATCIFALSGGLILLFTKKRH